MFLPVWKLSAMQFHRIESIGYGQCMQGGRIFTIWEVGNVSKKKKKQFGVVLCNVCNGVLQI